MIPNDAKRNSIASPPKCERVTNIANGSKAEKLNAIKCFPLWPKSGHYCERLLCAKNGRSTTDKLCVKTLSVGKRENFWRTRHLVAADHSPPNLEGSS
jgi:hypothetical protein